MVRSRTKLRRLREVREAYLVTQGELAERAGVTRGTVIDLELGRTEAQFRTARRLAAALGVEPHEITGEGA